MKTHSLKHTATACLTAITLGLGAATMAQAQYQPAWPSTAANNQGPALEPLSEQAEQFLLSNIAGKPVYTNNRQNLSTVEDFLVQPEDGKVHFAIVPSGGGAFGETYRLVPIGAFNTREGLDAMMVNVDRGAWDRVGTMAAPRLHGSITVNEQQHQRIAQHFGIPVQPANLTDMVRASSLRGRALQSGNQQIGVIDDVVIDLNNNVALPVLRPTSMAGVEQKFLVPFDRLQMDDRAAFGAITTNLNASDFQQFTATGYSTGSSGQPTSSAVTAVQQALERHHAIPRGSVQVVPESRLVLRGVVPNERARAEAEQIAQRAAPGMPIENNLQVRAW